MSSRPRTPQPTTSEPSVPDWVQWMPDSSLLVDIKKWDDEHPENRFCTMLDKIDEAIKNETVQSLLDFIPNTPLPAKSLAKTLITIVQLGIKAKKSKADASKFARQVVEDLSNLSEALGSDPSVELMDEAGKDIKRMAQLVNEICEWAHEQLKRNVVQRIGDAVFKKREDEWTKKLESAKTNFTSLTTARIRVTLDINERLRSIKEDLKPRVAEKYRHFEQSKMFCHKNTRESILKDLTEWIHRMSAPERCAWITGMPGSGKSTIAATIAATITKPLPQKPTVLCAQYFVSRNFVSTTDPSKFIPSIALQLADFPYTSNAIKAALANGKANTFGVEQAESLLLEPLRDFAKRCDSQPVVIVIDALDEFSKPPASTDSPDVPSVLSTIMSNLPDNVKIILTSRPERDIVKAMERITIKRIQLGADDPEIRDYIEMRLQAIAQDKGWDNWPSTEEIQTLSKRAAGLYIYATTSISWIAGQLSRREGALPAYGSELLRNIGHHGLGEPGDLTNLNHLYGFIVGKSNPDDLRSIVGCLIVLREPLCIGDIQSLLGISLNLVRFFDGFRSILITGTDQVTEATIPQMHKSFRDYITSDRPPPNYSIKSHEAHLMITKRCFRIFTQAKTSGLEYSWTSWCYHLCSAMENEITSADDVKQLVEVMAAWTAICDGYELGMSAMRFSIPDVAEVIRSGWLTLERVAGTDIDLKNPLNCLDGLLEGIKNERLERRLDIPHIKIWHNGFHATFTQHQEKYAQQS